MKRVPQLNRMHLEHEGLEMFLGRIEAAIMVTLWEQNRPLPSNKLQKLLVPTGDWAWQTIATTCKRLTEKGYLIHHRDKRVFAPAFKSEDEFINFCVGSVINRLSDQYPDSLKEVMQL